jgi:two-component system chemotaxis response regulator CheB
VPPTPTGTSAPRAATGTAVGRRPDLVVVGVSTGGPVTLLELLGSLGPLPCPLVVAQHMPATFTRGFAASLARTLKRPVEEGTDGTALEAGVITILKGGGDLVVQRAGPGRFTLRTAPAGAEVHHPSANLLFRSAAAEARAPVAVILTGMGDDGTAGARAFAERGHPVLVQDPASCAVDGMPTAAIRAGVASEVLSVAAIGRKLNAWFTL